MPSGTGFCEKKKKITLYWVTSLLLLVKWLNKIYSNSENRIQLLAHQVRLYIPNNPWSVSVLAGALGGWLVWFTAHVCACRCLWLGESKQREWAVELWMVLPPSIFPEKWKGPFARVAGALTNWFLPNNRNKYFQQTEILAPEVFKLKAYFWNKYFRRKTFTSVDEIRVPPFGSGMIIFEIKTRFSCPCLIF